MLVQVSVVVPVYNAEKHLSRTLQALQAQTLQEIEFILVDDGSNDSSPAICDIVCEQDSRFRCIHKENGGVSAARNDGIEMARGEYLAFCDADDIPDPNWAKKLFEKAKEENADIALCGFIGQRGNTCNENHLFDADVLTDKNEVREKMILAMCAWGGSYGNVFCGSPCRGAYKRELLTNHKIEFPKNIPLGEDLVFNAKAFEKANRIAFLHECLYFYAENPNSTTHSFAEERWQRYIILWHEVKKTFKELSYGEHEMQWENYQLIRYAVKAIIDGICSCDVSRKEKVKRTKKILTELQSYDEIKNLPSTLSIKQRISNAVLRPSLACIVQLYYQRVYNKQNSSQK